MTKIASMTGIARGTVIGKRDGVQPTDEAEHVFKFEMCGDWFDMRDLRAVLDHGRAPAPSPAIAIGCYWREVPRFSVVQRATDTRPLELRQQYQNLESEEVEGGGRL